MLANLRKALAVRGMRQVELARKAGCAPTVLSEIINGWREANPTLRKRIAEILQADELWLFSTAGEIPAPVAKPEAAETVNSHPAACGSRAGVRKALRGFSRDSE